MSMNEGDSRYYQSGKNQNTLLEEHMANMLSTFRIRGPLEK